MITHGRIKETDWPRRPPTWHWWSNRCRSVWREVPSEPNPRNDQRQRCPYETRDERRLFVNNWQRTPAYTRTQCIHTRTHAYKFSSGCEEVEHCTTQLNWTSQFSTTSQHHSPTRILPHNHTNISIHAHTMPNHTSPTRTCMLTMEKRI